MQSAKLNWILQVVAMISIKGLEHIEIVEGSVDGEIFWEFMSGALDVYESGDFDVVVMDNCAIHHINDVPMEVIAVSEAVACTH